jgi:hypothetical protein
MPSVKDTEMILDYIAENPMSEKSRVAKSKMGLSDNAIEAWKSVKTDVNNPQRTPVRNKIFDTIAKSIPASQEGGGGAGFVDRFVVQNLIDKDPILQQKYFEKKGYQTRKVGDSLEIKKAGEPQFKPVDPAGIDRFDLFDIVGDIGEAVTTGVASGAKALGLVGAPATGGAGLLAGSAAGGLATAGYEAAKQGVAKAVGARDEFDPGRISQAGMLGATVPLATGVVSSGLKGVGRLFGMATEKFFPKKAGAEAIEQASKTLGATPTPGQLFESPLIQAQESQLAQSSGKLGGMGLRKQIAENKKAVKSAAEIIVQDASRKTAFETGQQAEKQIIDSLSKKLEPAEVLYGKYESVFKRAAYKPKKESIIATIDDLSEKFKFDDETLGILGNFKSKLDDVANLDDLKKLRTIVGEKARSTPDKTVSRALNELYGELTNVRSKTLLDLSERRGGEFFKIAKQEIEQADGIYKGAVEEINTALGKRGGDLIGGPKAAARKFFEKTPEGRRIEKILATNDPAKIDSVKKAFPEAFDTLRRGKIEEIMKRAETKGEIDPRKLATIIDKLPAETAVHIFGPKNMETAKALKIYLDALPPMSGPSGTPAGLAFSNVFNILDQVYSVGKSTLQGALTRGALGKDIYTKAGKALGTAKARSALEFGARQFLPPQENGNFDIPANTTFQLPE